MPMNTTTAAAILRPEDVQALVVQPLTEQSIALQLSTVSRIAAHEARFPIVTALPTTGWTPEAAEIVVSEATVNELVVTPLKIAGLVPVSSELVKDSDPAAQKLVGDQLVADLRAKIDTAFFANTTLNGPSGLGSITPTLTYAGTALANVDPFIEAISKAESTGADVGSLAFVGNPANVLAAAKLKKLSTGSNEPLLAADAASPTRRTVAGVPLYTSEYAPAGRFYLIPKPKVFAVNRQDAELAVDSSVFFTSDRLAVRATLRVAFAFPHAAAVGAVLLQAAP